MRYGELISSYGELRGIIVAVIVGIIISVIVGVIIINFGKWEFWFGTDLVWN